MEEIHRKLKNKTTDKQPPPALSTQFFSLFPNERKEFVSFLASDPDYRKVANFVSDFESFESYSKKVESVTNTFESNCLLCRSYVGMVGKKFRKFMRFTAKRQTASKVFKVFLRQLKKILFYCLSLVKYFKTALLTSTSDPDIIYSFFTCLFLFLNKIFLKSKQCTISDVDEYFDVFQTIHSVFYSKIFDPKFSADLIQDIHPRIDVSNMRKQFNSYFSVSLSNSKILRSSCKKTIK